MKNKFILSTIKSMENFRLKDCKKLSISRRCSFFKGYFIIKNVLYKKTENKIVTKILMKKTIKSFKQDIKEKVQKEKEK